MHSPTQNIKIPVSDKVALKGVYVITKATLETPYQFALNDRIEAIGRKVKALYDEESRLPFTDGRRIEIARQLELESVIFNQLVRELNSICKTEREVYNNIVPTVARTMMANNMFNASPTDDPLVRWAEVGASVQAPANSDTALIDTSTNYRNAIASRSNTLNIGYGSAFFGLTEVSGTFGEAGIFASGTSTKGTGILVSRVSITVTKTTSQTLTIDWSLTYS